jgi:hypothetical protein
VSTTTDPDDPRLGRGVDAEPIPQHETYLVLSAAERARGFIRPLRRSYRHVGIPGPQFALAGLSDKQRETYAGEGYVKYENYPESELPALGRFWTQAQLDAVGKGCGTVTTMNYELAATYARQPSYYGATYCCGCRTHLKVGASGEFTWIDPDGSDSSERVGT